MTRTRLFTSDISNSYFTLERRGALLIPNIPTIPQLLVRFSSSVYAHLPFHTGVSMLDASWDSSPTRLISIRLQHPLAIWEASTCVYMLRSY